MGDLGDVTANYQDYGLCKPSQDLKGMARHACEAPWLVTRTLKAAARNASLCSKRLRCARMIPLSS